ncbi:MAG: thioredoxin family protein [Prevotella melaninogenica]
MDIVRLGVMTTPSVMVDGKLIISGRVPKVKEIIKLLNQ